MADGWVYILTNRPNGTLYVGVTDNLARRVWRFVNPSTTPSPTPSITKTFAWRDNVSKTLNTIRALGRFG